MPCNDDERLRNEAALAPTNGGWRLNGPRHTPPNENVVGVGAGDGKDCADEERVDFAEPRPVCAVVGH